MQRLRCALVIIAGCGRIDFAPLGGSGGGGGGDGAPIVVPASCLSLAPTCGASGAAPCCESPLVPGGTFLRSYDGVGFDDATHPATVSAFRLDKYEVTVARFRAFVAAGMGTQATAPAVGAGARELDGVPDQAGWDASWTAMLPADSAALASSLACSASYATWTDAPAANENRPINCVDWHLAVAFCIWDGGFLPTETQWNYAAAGGDEQRAYPWSSPPDSLALDPSDASYAPTFDTDCNGDGLPGCTLDDIILVGTRPAGDGRWGQSDLGGNVYEWTFDGYEDNLANPCDDCASLTSSYNLRAVRGGAFRYAASGLRNGYRNAWTADDRSGFRCAREP